MTQYTLTTQGRLALEQYRRYSRGVARLDDAGDLLSALPEDAGIDLDAVVGGRTAVAPEDAPYEPLERVLAATRGSDDFRAALPVVNDAS